MTGIPTPKYTENRPRKDTYLVLNRDVDHDENIITRLGLGPNVELHDPEGDAGTHALLVGEARRRNGEKESIYVLIFRNCS